MYIRTYAGPVNIQSQKHTGFKKGAAKNTKMGGQSLCSVTADGNKILLGLMTLSYQFVNVLLPDL